MSQIWHLVLQEIRTHLLATMNLGITDSKDPEYVDVIKIGRFLDNPTQKGVIISLNSGDDRDPYFIDGMVGDSDVRRYPFHMPTFEIGEPGSYWWRRGRAELGCWYVGGNRQPSEEVAHDHAYNVLGRLLSNLGTTRVANLVDQFGEGAMAIFVDSDHFYPSGGNSQFIWRGAVKFRVLTRHP